MKKDMTKLVKEINESLIRRYGSEIVRIAPSGEIQRIMVDKDTGECHTFQRWNEDDPTDSLVEVFSMDKTDEQYRAELLVMSTMWAIGDAFHKKGLDDDFGYIQCRKDEAPGYVYKTSYHGDTIKKWADDVTAMELIEYFKLDAKTVTQLAREYMHYDGEVQMETIPGTWVTIHNPLFRRGVNFRPKPLGV